MNKIILWYVTIVGMLLMLEIAAYAKPSQDLPAYHNEIVDIAYMPEMHALQVQLQQAPVCFYAPATYQELVEGQVMQYTFPRTEFGYGNEHTFADQLAQFLKSSGIEVSIASIAGKNFGLQMQFLLDDPTNSKVIKVIDSAAKTVTFYSAKKI